MRYLITGGAGFIGSCFVRHILRRHRDVRVTTLDKLTYAGNRQNLADVRGDRRHRFLRGDICDAALMRKLLTGVDVVVNFAAETHVDRSIRHGGAFVRTNVAGVVTLLEAARRAGVRRFLQVSTDEVYGSILEGTFTEGSPLRASSPYAASKAAGDLLARAYQITHGVPVVIARCTNNFGPYQHPEKFIPRFITNALCNLPLPLFGDGLHVREWISVEDHCAALDLILHADAPEEVYNIGSGDRRPNRDVARLILQVLGKPEALIQPVPDRLGHDRRYAIDSSRIRALGFAPQRSFEEALAGTAAWYRSHPAWWRARLVPLGADRRRPTADRSHPTPGGGRRSTVGRPRSAVG
ncbi:MAG TPA: dTDP-glucose 4,6-dehydratase [Candidatus Sulfotelmatobacter sp.]|nr:dTDP-glucose 4,6-dehydratase [Candidatus Sulfotelmatobacter sp.]